MRIKSNFRDYYDSVQQYGQDDILYIREPKSFVERGNGGGSSSIYIGFAGKIYPILCIQPDILCFTIDDCDKYYSNKDNVILKGVRNLYWNLDERGRFEGRHYHHLSRAKLIRWFANDHIATMSYEQPQIDWQTKYLPTIFEKYKAPIFHIATHDWDHVKITINPCVRKYELYRVLSPYQAYQELLMYLSNQARPIKEPPKIDDRTMVEIKGFDKFSFRKQSSKRK
jgi:hypothetical protein